MTERFEGRGTFLGGATELEVQEAIVSHLSGKPVDRVTALVVQVSLRFRVDQKGACLWDWGSGRACYGWILGCFDLVT